MLASNPNTATANPFTNIAPSSPAPSQPERLRIGGLIPFSTVDFPGRLSAVVFCQGCPWRCRYCHNPHLQTFCTGNLTWSEVERFLQSRRGFLEAVVFSGGEPLAQPGLEDAIRTVRALGYEVGLHTAGIYPNRLARILPLVDWVGLDIKAPLDGRYDAITRVRRSARAVRSALDEILCENVDYEVRTTVHPALLTEEGQEKIQRQLSRFGSKPTRWQEFRPQGCADADLVAMAEA